MDDLTDAAWMECDSWPYASDAAVHVAYFDPVSLVFGQGSL
jgi:hypothetical protein